MPRSPQRVPLDRRRNLTEEDRGRFTDAIWSLLGSINPGMSDEGDVVLARVSDLGAQGKAIALTRAECTRIEACRLAELGDYQGAIARCQDAVRTIMQQTEYSAIGQLLSPLPELSLRGYVNVEPHDRIALMKCSNDIASWYLGAGDKLEALRWFGESEALYDASSLLDRKPLFAWNRVHYAIPSFYLERMRTLVTLCNVFLSLGNTSQAVARVWAARGLLRSLTSPSPPELPDLIKQVITELEKMLKSDDEITHLMRLKHPDASLSRKVCVQDEQLQIMGSWQKVELPKDEGERMQPRMGFASFVFNGCLYVLGGQKSLDGPDFRDFLRLDLANTSKGWRLLPAYPLTGRETGHISGWKMSVHDREKRAYVFSGRDQVNYFDLENERWGSLRTHWSVEGGFRAWPYPCSDLSDFAMEILGDTMYVFGGSHADCGLGCNLFLALDLLSGKWRRLSGYPGGNAPTLGTDAGGSGLRPEWTCPGPRKHPSMWVEGCVGEERVCLMYGEADRVSAGFSKLVGGTDGGRGSIRSDGGEGEQGHAAKAGYGYGDLWSWDVRQEVWLKERIGGNPPCARSEMACTYNPNMNKVVLFGGYSPTLPSVLPSPVEPTPSTSNDLADPIAHQPEHLTYTYYADTYVFDPVTRSFQQVFTRGFPTYRAQGYLFSDPHTGKVFLFGGYTNVQFVRDQKRAVSKTFADLWWLRVDLRTSGGSGVGDVQNEGARDPGYFEGVDLDEEAKTARVGPWQRCFNCGSAGPWRKCGGGFVQRSRFLLRCPVLKGGVERTQGETPMCQLEDPLKVEPATP